MALKPLSERHIIQSTHIPHTPFRVDQRSHNRGRSKGQRVGQFIQRRQLRGREKGSQAVEGCANLLATDIQPEIEFPDIAAFVAERMGVVFEEQVLQHAAFCHEAEQVEVASEKYVETHFNMVAVFILERSNFTANKWTCFVDIDFIALV